MTISNTGTTATIARDGAAGLIRSTVDAVTNLPGIDTTRDIKTLTITFAPEINRTADGKETVVGYTFSETVKISVAGLLSGLMSSVIDTAVAKAGDALRINGVTLSISSDAKKEAMAQARRAAVADALATAQLLASAAGVKLGAPVSIVDSNNGFPDAGNVTSCGAQGYQASAVSQIETGVTEVRATVTVTFALL
ncbi:hypothetical protein ACKKBG_A35995 [Auxenochlorella protothecoides x Auxenochlorella symbiontica]